MKLRSVARVFFVFLLSGFFYILRPDVAQGLTSIQTSTTLGYFRDYQQNGRLPLYHAWSARGLYGSNAFETSLDFILNNDFAINQWKFFPTQAMVQIQLQRGAANWPEHRSRLQLGRQFFTEGFEIAIMDGAQAPIYFGESRFGVNLYGGVVHPTDVEQTDVQSPLMGGTLIGELAGFHGRVGAYGRDNGLETQYAYGSILKQFEVVPLAPQFFVKEEFNLTTSSFNQAVSELQLALSDSISLVGSHSYLNPRPLEKTQTQSFVYRIFSISPSEVLGLGANIQLSSGFGISGLGRQIQYNSGAIRETADIQNIAMDISLGTGHRLSPNATYLAGPGGTLWDGGLRYIFDVSNTARWDFEYDIAYFEKINNIKSWAEHVRTGYESRLAKHVKGMLYLEGESNQYFVFDVRGMAYVTNFF